MSPSSGKIVAGNCTTENIVSTWISGGIPIPVAQEEGKMSVGRKKLHDFIAFHRVDKAREGLANAGVSSCLPESSGALHLCQPGRRTGIA
jgi:hypothetical protein